MQPLEANAHEVPPDGQIELHLCSEARWLGAGAGAGAALGATLALRLRLGLGLMAGLAPGAATNPHHSTFTTHPNPNPNPNPQARYYAWSQSCGAADAGVNAAALQQALTLTPTTGGGAQVGLTLAPCDADSGHTSRRGTGRGCVLATPATPLATGTVYTLTLPAATAVNEEGSVTSSGLTARRRPQAVAPSRSRGRSLWPAAEVCSLQPKSVAPGLGAA